MSKTTSALVALGVVAGLSAAALPLSSYAATEIKGAGDPLTATGTVDVELKIEETLSMYITEDDNDTDISKVSLTSTNGADYEADPIAIKVDAKNKNGYKLTMHGSYTNAEITDAVATSLYNENGTEIATGDLESTTASQWGYKVQQGADGSALDTTWQLVKASDAAATIDSLSTAGSQTTQVTFGAHVLPSQEAGTYNGQVTFTATAGLNS